MFRPTDLEQVHGRHVLTDAAVETGEARMVSQPSIRDNMGDKVRQLVTVTQEISHTRTNPDVWFLSQA